PPSTDGHNQRVSPSSPNDKSQPAPALQVGQVFIPRRVLNSGMFVPDSLLACRLVSNGARLLWARLARYAGTNGECFPLLSTLAADLGFSERQVQRYLAELVSARFLRVHQRGFNKSNLYEFLWHPALAPPGVVARGMEQTKQQTHNPLQEETVLCRVVQKPFQLFRAAEPEKIAATGQEDSTTDVASSGTTELSSSVSTTGLSSCNGSAKNRNKMQVIPPRIVEVVEIPTGSACTSPQPAKRRPLTQEEAGVREQLERFQVELEIAGTILPSTVRRIMASVPTERLPEALLFVADKLYWRRRRASSYRRHVGWGFVLRVLEQDFAVPSRIKKRPVERLANLTGKNAPLDGFAVASTPVSAPAWGSCERWRDPGRPGRGGNSRRDL